MEKNAIGRTLFKRIENSERKMSENSDIHKPQKRIGELLIERGFITERQLEQALKIAKERNIKVGEALFSIGALSRDAIYWVLANQLDMNYLELVPEMVDEQLIKQFSIQDLWELCCVPLYEDNSDIHFAIADPTSKEIIQKVIHLKPGKNVRLHLALPEKIKDILSLYGARYYQPRARREIFSPKETSAKQTAITLPAHLTKEELESYWQNFLLNLLLLPDGKTCWCYKTPNDCRLVSLQNKEFENIRHYPVEIFPFIYARVNQMATSSISGDESLLFLRYESVEPPAPFLVGELRLSDKHIIWFHRLHFFCEEEFFKSYPEAYNFSVKLKDLLDNRKRLLVGGTDGAYIKQCFYSILCKDKAYSGFPPSVFVEREIGVYFPEVAQIHKKRFNAQSYLKYFRENDLPLIFYEADLSEISCSGNLISGLFADKWKHIVIYIPFTSSSEMEKNLSDNQYWSECQFKPIFIQDNQLTVIGGDF